MEQKYEQLIQLLLGKKFGSVDDWFSSDELFGLRQSLIDRYQDDAFRLAGIGNQHSETRERSIRSDQIHWLYKSDLVPSEQVFFERIDGFVDYLNRTCFAGIQSYEFHYAVYESGTFYKRHSDQFNNDDRRRFSMVLYLNEDWQPDDGGQLALYNNGVEIIEPTFGKLLFFESDIEHEVLLSKAPRYSLTGWLRTL